MTMPAVNSADMALVQGVTREVGKRVVGQEYMVERLLIALLTGGHVLLEGVPGLAKTLTVRTLAETIHTTFQRIQFTPDLLPADVVGTQIFDQSTGSFSVKRGPSITCWITRMSCSEIGSPASMSTTATSAFSSAVWVRKDA